MAKSPASILHDVNGNAIGVLLDGSVYRLQVSSKGRVEIALGAHADSEPFSGFGERSDIGVAAAGEDVWRGVANIVPTPADAGEALEVVSSSVNDVVAGAGVQTLLVDYLDASGTPQTTPVTMNGTTAVALTPTDVRFVQKFYTTTAGSNGVAIGNIIIRNIATPANVYNRITSGGNMSLTPHRMVPLGKVLVVTSWHATESKGKRLAFKLRSTSEGFTIRPGVFLFKDAMYLALTGLTAPVLFTVPALAIIKISAWGDVAVGAEASASWEGLLFDT